MSYLQKIAELQARAEESRNQAREFQNDIREDAFNTAEAKKEDFLGHISRGIEDMTRKLETAGAVAGTTSAIVKHIKHLRGKAKASKEAPDQEQPRRTPAEEEENPSADAGGTEAFEMQEMPSSRPTGGLEDLGFTEQDAEGLFKPPEAPEPEGRAPLFPEVQEAEGREEAAEQAEASSKATFSEAQKTQMTKPDSQEEAGGESRPAELGESETGGESADALRARVGQAQDGNFSTEGDVLDRGQQALPEEGAGAEGDAPSGLAGDVGGVGDGAAELGAETAAEGGAEAAAAMGIGDVALGAIPIIGDVLMAASLIGSVVEASKGAKKEEAAEEAAAPKDPISGVAVATTGIDGKSLLQQ